MIIFGRSNFECVGEEYLKIGLGTYYILREFGFFFINVNRIWIRDILEGILHKYRKLNI